MMNFASGFHLNIRQKIVVVFALGITVFYVIGFVGYKNFMKIEKKVRIVECAYRLQNTILEVRRYEKNYLLYGLEGDYQQALAYLEDGKEILESVQSDMYDLQAGQQTEELQNEMVRYGQLMKNRVTGRQGENAGLDLRRMTELQLRETGKHLVDLSLQLAGLEHDRILKIINALQVNLVAFGLVILFSGAFMMIFLRRKILKPIAAIEKNTLRIARGDLRLVPVRQTHDETQAVIEAFNRMVTEIEKRQKQLVEAQKLSSLGILTSGIAHQLNNPLNNISTSCQILMEEMDDGDIEYVKKLLTNINQEVDRARDIVKGLLEFSREREFQLDWVNLNNLILQTTRLVSSQLPSGVEVTNDIPEDLDLYADGQKLQEVFLNLLINAAQAMPDGNGHIYISARKDPDLPEFVEIKVRDTGIGVPAEDLPSIFDPFFSTKEVGFGTGLGLAVAYGIIDRHGGSITAESKVGEGTTFTINLPGMGNNSSGEESA